MDKIRVLMFCAMGASSSLLAAKTEEAAKAKGIEIEITLLSAAEAAIYDLRAKPVDVVLIAPQVRFKKRSIAQVAAPLGIPVEDIESITYGMMDGEKLCEQIERALKQKQA
jgi:PTS system cellobiose-specific IIB component